MPARIVYPPVSRRRRIGDEFPTVFLAGSIEMGAAEDWQRTAAAAFADAASIIYNPRRADWDSSWTQDIDDPNFNPQVTWELDMIELADVVAFHFDPNTKAPITLMELGIVAVSKPAKAFVSCPERYWRRGNVEIVCERYGVSFHDSLDEMLDASKRALTKG